MLSNESGHIRIVGEEEASKVIGGSLYVTDGIQSHQIIVVPYGIPNYDQEDIDAEAYYQKYADYNRGDLISFGVTPNNGAGYVNTLEYVTNNAGTGHYAQVAIIEAPISKVLTFIFVQNEFPAPHFLELPFVNGVASGTVTGLHSNFTSVDISATISDRGDGTTHVVLDMVAHGVNG